MHRFAFLVVPVVALQRLDGKAGTWRAGTPVKRALQ